MIGNGTASASGRSRPGLLRPPNIFLAAIVSGVALQQWRSLAFVPLGAAWLGAALCLAAVLLFVQGRARIQGRRHSCPGTQAHHGGHPERPIRLQPQSYLPVLHPARTGTFGLAEQP